MRPELLVVEEGARVRVSSAHPQMLGLRICGCAPDSVGDLIRYEIVLGDYVVAHNFGTHEEWKDLVRLPVWGQKFPVHVDLVFGDHEVSFRVCVAIDVEDTDANSDEASLVVLGSGVQRLNIQAALVAKRLDLALRIAEDALFHGRLDVHLREVDAFLADL